MKTLPLTVYVLGGDPVALARARYSIDNRRIYDSQKSIKLLAGIGLRSQHNDQPLLSGPLHLDVTFFMRIPPNSKRTTLLHQFKPDIDNLIKYLLDVSQSVLFDDDCVISQITAIKQYDTKPRTEFTLRSIKDVLSR